MPARIEDGFEIDVTPFAKGADSFHRLVADLSSVLGPSSGLDSADVDPKDLQRLMAAYTSKESEWMQYAWGDPSRTYTRNLVDKGNGKSNLVCIQSSRQTIDYQLTHRGNSLSLFGRLAKGALSMIMQTRIA